MPTMAFYGRVYADPKDKVEECRRVEHGAPWDLTREHLRRFAPLLVGKPVRVEHSESEVGTIRAAQIEPRTGALFVAFDLHDTPAGKTARELIRSGAAPELSLRHDYYSGLKGMSVEEVSLVSRGARRACTLMSEAGIRARGLWDLLPRSSAMASESDAQQEPPQKRARETTAADSDSITDYVAKLAEKLPEEDARQLYGRFVKLSETAIKKDEELKNAQARCTELQNRIESEQKIQATSSEEIIRVLNEMYGHAAQGGKLPEDVRRLASTELSGASNLRSVLNTVVPVACSALQRATHERKIFSAEHRQLQHLEEQLHRMGADYVPPERVSLRASKAAPAEVPRVPLPPYLAEAFAKPTDMSVKETDIYPSRA